MGHTTNKAVLFSIIPKYMTKEADGIKISWEGVLKDYEEATGHKRAIRTLQTYITNEDKEVLYSQRNKQQEELPPNELEINADGSQRLLAYQQMSKEQSKDPNFVMEVNGYDPSKWDLIRLRVNEWTARNGDNEELYNYQIRLDVKPKDVNKLTQQDIIKLNKDYEYKHEQIDYQHKHTDRAMEVGFADLHIGSNQFDFEMLKDKVRNIRYKAELENVERMYIVFNGDMLHVDNVSKTTNAGTQLEMDMTAYDMMRLGKEVTDFIIHELSFVETEVYWVQGNHSRLAEFTLFDGLKDRWEDNEHITFDVSELRRKAFLYGKQLVGLYHGDMPKKNMFDWLARDFRELWGQARYVEQHSGHYHNEDVTSKGAIINRVMPTIKETDYYEYSLGYDNISMAIQTFIYSKEEGLKQINYF